MDNIKKTERTYGFLWARNKGTPIPDIWHFNMMQEVIGEPIVRGQIGIDIGSGCGYDTYIIAKNNPSIKMVSVDISDGVYRTKELTLSLENVRIIKSSILEIPIRDNVFDFAYSFGVLHHTANPRKGLLEIARILKKNSPAFLYLYEDHSEHPIKYIAVKIIAKIRKITVIVPRKIIYALCWLISPFVFIIFTLPSRVLKKFKATQNFSEAVPFNLGRNLFSLRYDLYDRFSAPIEYRFSRQEVYDFLNQCGFCNITITRLKDSAGWVAWGYKR